MTTLRLSPPRPSSTRQVTRLDQRVQAEPFRAHLRFLINSGSVSAEVVAELADLPHDQLRPLLLPPHAGGVDQLPVETARRLFMITAATVRAVRYELVPAAPVRSGLRRLLNHGWSLDRLTDYLRMRLPTLQSLLTDRTLSCTRLTELRVAAALRTAAPASALRPVA